MSLGRGVFLDPSFGGLELLGKKNFCNLPLIAICFGEFSLGYSAQKVICRYLFSGISFLSTAMIARCRTSFSRTCL